jgi:ADP-dependent NAD(P)H-hydrate dehydratase / NAD(P)H-hydrate epimerase
VKLITAAESRELDQLSQNKYGVPSYSLMTRAGEAVADAACHRFPEAVRAGVLVIAGRGNNGGDAMVAARRFAQHGAPVRAVLLARRPELKGDAATACAEFASHRGAIAEVGEAVQLEAAFRTPCGTIIDGIFGTGLNAEVKGLPRRAIELINAAGAMALAVDIASGVNADTGAVMGDAVKAALTVTFGLAKFGHVSYPGAERCGELEVVDIGFPPAAIEDIAPRGRFLERDDVQPLVSPRVENSHKGMYGHPLVIAGGRGKAGAALLAARAALRMGAGLVTAAIPESVSAIVAAGQAELMTEPITEHDGHFDGLKAAERLASILPGKDALVVGPGIGVSDDTKCLISWLTVEGVAPGRSLLIDADGLNALAAIGCDRLKGARGPIMMTPHPGEMARLLGTSTAAVNADRISAARRLAEQTGAYVLLKGARSVIAGPDATIYVNSTGNPGMGTPGMGDALSGIIGALLGQKLKPLDALALGVFIHGDAADRVAQRLGPVGYLTGDLIDELPHAMAALSS